MDLFNEAEEVLEWAVLHLEALAVETQLLLLQPFCRAWTHGIKDEAETLSKAAQSEEGDTRGVAKALLDALSMRTHFEGSMAARLMATLKIGLGVEEAGEDWLKEFDRAPSPAL